MPMPKTAPMKTKAGQLALKIAMTLAGAPGAGAEGSTLGPTAGAAWEELGGGGAKVPQMGKLEKYGRMALSLRGAGQDPASALGAYKDIRGLMRGPGEGVAERTGAIARKAMRQAHGDSPFDWPDE